MTADTCTVLEEDWEEFGDTSGGRINDGVVHEVVFEVRYCKLLGDRFLPNMNLIYKLLLFKLIHYD